MGVRRPVNFAEPRLLEIRRYCQGQHPMCTVAQSEPRRSAGEVAPVGKDEGRDSAIGEAVMAPKRRIRKLAALVHTTPETLTEVIGDVLRETVNELQRYKPSAGGRVARDIRRHRRIDSGVWEGL
jgi:hypothetical protein